jgi:hypothetical protein
MYYRNALTGFLTGWHLKASVPSTSASDINSNLEPACVDQFDYAADGSEDDRKEATSTKDNGSSKVCQPNYILTKLLTAGMCFFKPYIKIDFRSSRKPAVIRKTRTSFNNFDLPAGTLKNWQMFYLPVWYQYLSTLKDPWSLSELLQEAQHI